jgi:hypothetical protein
MKRIHLLGVCLVAMMALVAVSMASTASAGEFFFCSPVAKKTGKYADAKCTTLKEKNGKAAGNFEKLSVSPCINVGKKKGRFADSACTVPDEKKGKPAGSFETCFKTGKCKYSSTGGEATLSTPAFGKNNVTCKANTDVGEVTGNFTDTDRVIFTGCEFLGLPCQSSGPNSTPSGKPGVIITNLLDSKLIDFPEKYPVVNQKFELEEIGPVEGEVWDRLVSSEHEPFSSEFECGGVVFLRTQGSDAGAYTKASLNKLSETAEVNFEDTHGQGLMTEALNEKGEWVPPGGAPSLEEAGTAKLTNSMEIEVRAVAPPKWWVEGKLLTGSEPIAESTTVEEPFKLILTQEKVAEIGSIQCSEVKVKGGMIEAPRARTESAVEYAGCKVFEPKPNSSVENALCHVVGAHFVTNALKGTLEGPLGSEKLKFVPQSGSEIGGFEIEGASCSFKGLFHASGDMVCNYNEVETEKVEHPLKFTPTSGSEVTLSGPAETKPKEGVTVSYEVHLSSGKLWSAF